MGMTDIQCSISSLKDPLLLLSLMLYLNRTSRPQLEDVKPTIEAGHYHLTSQSQAPDCPQLKILRVNGSLLFGAVDHVQQNMMAVDAKTRGEGDLKALISWVLKTPIGVRRVDGSRPWP